MEKPSIWSLREAIELNKLTSSKRLFLESINTSICYISNYKQGDEKAALEERTSYIWRIQKRRKFSKKNLVTNKLFPDGYTFHQKSNKELQMMLEKVAVSMRK